jgi:hypothetical protein
MALQFRTLAAILLCVAAADVSVTFADGPNGAIVAYRRTLEEFGVEPNGTGAVGYLKQLHPTPERQQQVAAQIEKLASRSFAEREAATQQLLRMPDLPTGLLIKASQGDDPEVRWRASEVLKKSQGQSTRVIFAALKVIAADKTPDAAPAVLAAIPLCHETYLAAAAGEALRAAAQAKDVDLLRTSLANGTAAQRVAAVGALCAVTDAVNRDSLFPLLDDADERVRLEVARSLADVGERRSLAALVALLSAEATNVRSEAGATLRGLTGQELGYAAYDSADARAAAIKKWSDWVAGPGKEAPLKFPVPRHFSARGDLGGHTLVSTGSRNQIIEFDASGKEVWSFPFGGAWSAEKLISGNVLIASYAENRVVEVEPATKKIVWSHEGINAMKTKPLANGSFLISDFNGKRVIEMTREKEIVWEQPTEQECFDCDRLPNGNTIFGCPNFVREVTPDHELVREWKIDGRLNGFQALASGNILVANYGASEVVELSPDGKRVWTFKETNPCDVFRLPEGNTLISTGQRIIEIGPDDKVLRVICECQYGSARR